MEKGGSEYPYSHGGWRRECTTKITKISNMLYHLLPCTVCKYLTKGRGHKIRKSACQSFNTESKCDHGSFTNAEVNIPGVERHNNVNIYQL